MSARAERLLGYGLALAAALLFSTKSILIKLAYEAGAGAEALFALRMLIALPIYLAVWGLHERRHPGAAFTRAQALGAAGVGVLGYGVSSYLDMKGLEYVSAAVERLILFTYPFFVAIIGAALFGLRVQRGAIAGLLVSYAGLALVLQTSLAGPVTLQLLGVGLVFGSAITYALFQLLAGRLVGALGSIRLTCISMSSAAACGIGAFLCTHPVAALSSSPAALAYAALLAVVGTVLPSFLLTAALRTISPLANSAIGAASPVLTIALAVLVLGESLSAQGLFGSLLVVAGAAWFTLKDAFARRA